MIEVELSGNGWVCAQLPGFPNFPLSRKGMDMLSYRHEKALDCSNHVFRRRVLHGDGR